MEHYSGNDLLDRCNGTGKGVGTGLFREETLYCTVMQLLTAREQLNETFTHLQ